MWIMAKVCTNRCSVTINNNIEGWHHRLIFLLTAITCPCNSCYNSFSMKDSLSRRRRDDDNIRTTMASWTRCRTTMANCHTTSTLLCTSSVHNAENCAGLGYSELRLPYFLEWKPGLKYKPGLEYRPGVWRNCANTGRALNISRGSRFTYWSSLAGMHCLHVISVRHGTIWS